jgi:hypothetical protein
MPVRPKLLDELLSNYKSPFVIGKPLSTSLPLFSILASQPDLSLDTNHLTYSIKMRSPTGTRAVPGHFGNRARAHLFTGILTQFSIDELHYPDGVY